MGFHLKITECAELEETQQDQIQLLAQHRTIPKSHTVCPKIYCPNTSWTDWETSGKMCFYCNMWKKNLVFENERNSLSAQFSSKVVLDPQKEKSHWAPPKSLNQVYKSQHCLVLKGTTLSHSREILWPFYTTIKWLSSLLALKRLVIHTWQNQTIMSYPAALETKSRSLGSCRRSVWFFSTS